ncbi:hypothetical protein PanWU01x14_240940 [Parasponia andersonii]|uniref:Gag-pol polyprotein n=1 Tax=Parasponia andersonii TaxID=3476 RepID=A0A2P5BGL6_PARAD|nr:hypothetical protein PanWU01x14_240940 [Parasponia andersonii]
MRVFIRALDIKARRSILIGWSLPIVRVDDGTISLKSEIDWSPQDDLLASYNTKALHAIFNGCDIEQIMLISSCETAKEAWEIL